MKLLTTDIKKILDREQDTSKFLSPNINKLDGNHLLVYAKRLKQKKKYAEINFAVSTDLINWKKNNLIAIKPESIGYECDGLISPSFIHSQKKNFLFLEAQNKNKSDLILLETKDNLKWYINSKYLRSKENTIFQCPYIFKYKNTFKIFYTQNRNQMYAETLNENFDFTKIEEVMTSTLDNENFCIYSPSIISLDNKYFMFYAAWPDDKSGNINLAVSNDLSNWEKIGKSLIKLNGDIKIVSEPSVISLDNNLFIFFEYKNPTGWDLGFIKISKKSFIKLFYDL